MFSSPNARKSASMLLSESNNLDQHFATVVGRSIYTFLRYFVDGNVHNGFYGKNFDKNVNKRMAETTLFLDKQWKVVDWKFIF